jgi:hypothetical protein
MLYYSMYGNAIFPLLHCITGHHKRPLRCALNEREDAEGNAMKRVRVIVEWPYETATNSFFILHSRYHKNCYDTIAILMW